MATTTTYDPALDRRHVCPELDIYVRGADLNTAPPPSDWHLHAWYVVLAPEGPRYEWVEGEATPWPNEEIGLGTAVMVVPDMETVRHNWGMGDVMRYYPFNVWA